MIFLARLSTSFALLTLTIAPAIAQQIDLSLNVLYSSPGNPNSGGTWQLVGKSSHSGIVAVNAYLSGVDAPIANVAPTGIVNGDACFGSQVAGCAGFYNFAANIEPQYLELVVGQAPLFPTGGDQEGLFYGVGTLTNGSPNYPSKPAGTNSLGPNITTLTNVAGVPWATGDVFSNPAWNTAAILAAGTFPVNQTPGFFGGGENLGSVFTTVGDINDGGARSSFASTTVTEIVRTNLVLTNIGDYNGNGVVDAPDYTVWRNTRGATGVTPSSGADGSGNGIIDQADYDVWRQNFGRTVGSGTGAGGLAVPEPATGILAAIAAVFAAFPLKTALRGRRLRRLPRHLTRLCAGLPTPHDLCAGKGRICAKH
jgi:hypothetical protein